MSTDADATPERRPARQVDITTAVVVALLTGGGGGLAGTVATSQSVSGELKETRAVILGQLRSVEQKLDEQGRVQGRLEQGLVEQDKRTRELELWRARLDAERAANPR